MAPTILPFVIPRRAPAKARETGETAKIIIFPGVRYESFSESDDEGKGGQARRPARRSRKAKAR